MPFLDDDLGLTGFQPIGHPDKFKSTPDAPEPPANPAGFTDRRLWGAAFERENEIGALGPVLEHRAQQFGDPDPDHNPWTSIVDTDLQPYWEYFLTSRNQKETDYLIARVRREMENTKILDEAGWKGFLASGVASIAAPSTLLSGPGLLTRGARGWRLVEETLRKGARVGAEAAGGAAIQETALHQMQATRTMNESLLAVGGATVLGSLLGAGIAQYKGRSIARLGERMEADLRMPVDPALDPLGPGGMQAAERLRAERLADVTTRIEPETGSGLGTSAGAKAVEIAENKVAGTAGIGEALSATSPLTRVAYSSLGSARDALHRLVESPLALKQNEQGIPTGPRGGSVETMIKTQGEARLYRAVSALDQAFAEYRFGTKDATAAPLRAGLKRMMGDRSALTFKEFKEEVGRAMRAGDVHDNKFVAQAAKAMRKELFDPLKAMAQKHGLLPEDAMLPENYLTRVYDVDTILKQYPRFINTLVDYLKRGQASAEREAAELEAKIAELEQKAQKPKGGDDGDDGPGGGGTDPQPDLPLAPKSPDAVREEFVARTEDRIEDYRDKIDDINIALKAAEGEEKAALLKELDDAKARVKDTEEELAKSVAARADADDVAVYRDPESGDEMSQSEVEDIISMWRIVKDEKRPPRPAGLQSWVMGAGRLQDQGGEITNLLGGKNRQLISGKGMTLDDAALKAYESGFFPERPSINEFLDALSRDINVEPVIRLGDEALLEDWRAFRDMEEQLDRLGIAGLKNEAAIHNHFRSSESAGAGARDRGSPGSSTKDTGGDPFFKLAQLDAAIDDAITEMRGILPEGVGVRVFDDPDELGPRLAADVRNAGAKVDAFFDPQTAAVYLARHAVDPAGRLTHETVHALRSMKLLTDKEVELLAKAAAEKGDVFPQKLQATYREAYANRPDPAKAIEEEAAAHLVEARKNGTDFGREINGIVDRVLQFFERLRNKLNGYGFQTADDVIEAVLSGEMAKRKIVRDAMVQEDITAFALRPLDMSPEARKARAEAMGFDTSKVYYHGTTNADKIRADGFKAGWAYFSDSKLISDSYQAWAKGDSPDTFAVHLKTENPAYYDAKGQKYTDIANKVFSATWDAQKKGHDSIIIRNIRDHNDSSVPVKPHTTVVVFSPNQVRSINARFDPSKADSPNLMFAFAGEQIDQMPAHKQRYKLVGGPGDPPKIGRVRASLKSIASQIGIASEHATQAALGARFYKNRPELGTPKGAVRQVNEARLEAKDDLATMRREAEGQSFYYDIQTGNGQSIGSAQGWVVGNKMHFDWLGAPSMSDKANIGIRAIKDLREQVRKDFPNVTEFVGYRVSGARDKADAANRMQSVIMFAFAGERAKTADLDKLSKAKTLEAEGADRTKIWKETGWFRGVDQKWRFEIDDSQVPVTKRLSEQFLADYPAIGSALPHTDLFRAYPDLKGVRLGVENEATGGSWHSRDGGIVRLRPVQDGDFTPEASRGRKSVTLHELQHAVQDREGLSSGANPNQFIPRIAEARYMEGELRAKVQRMQDAHSDEARVYLRRAEQGDRDAVRFVEEAQSKWGEKLGRVSDDNPFGLTPEQMVAAELGDADPIFRRAVQQYNDAMKTSRLDPDDLYKRSAGEVEARTVQKRMNMTPEERAKRPPWEDYDVAEKDQIVRMPEDQGPMFAMSQDIETGKSMRRDLDALGYYSKALEAARDLKQAKGTPEQMLAQLKKAGVKDAEIAATRLNEALSGKSSITKSEIIKHLEENRVGLKEVVREAKNAKPDRVRNYIAEEFGNPSPGYRIEETKWQQYSLDPSNPTYRETVLHLPLSPMARLRMEEMAPFGPTGSGEAMWDGRTLVRGVSEAPFEIGNQWGRITHWPVTYNYMGADQGERFIVNSPNMQNASFKTLDEARRAIEASYHNQAGPAGNDMAKARDDVFRSGHFPEPNIIGHMMTSMTRHEGKPVFLIDQIQSDWGQKLRDGGVRDEAKIAELRQKLADAEAKQVEAFESGRQFLLANKPEHADIPQSAQGMSSILSQYVGLARQAGRSGEDVWAALRGAEWVDKTQQDINLLKAELRTAEAATPGNPLVNTTDQWTTTTLRRAIRQAIEADADYIAIPHGDTVLSYNPGDTNGMRGFYGSRATEGIVPKNLRKLLQSIDKEAQPQKVETLTTPSGERGYKPGADSEFEPNETGFTLFPLTPTVKDKVRAEGMPMFALRQEPTPELPAAVQPVANEIRRGMAKLPRAVRNAIARSELDQAQAFETLATTALRTTARKGTVHAEDMADIKALGLVTDDEWRAMSKRAEKLRPIYRTDAAHQARFEAKFGPDATEQVEDALTREAMAQMMREGRAGSSFSPDIDAAMTRTWDLLDQVGYRLRQSGIRTDEQLASTLRPAPQTAAPVPQIDPAAATGELQGILGPYLEALRNLAPERGLPDFSVVMDEAGRVAGATDTAPNIKFTRDADGMLNGVEYQGRAYSIDRDAMGNIRGLMTAAQKAVADQEAEVRIAASRALEGLGLPEAQARAVVDQAIDFLKASPDMVEQLQDVVSRALSGDGPRFALADAEKGSEKPKKPKTPKQEINELQAKLVELRKFADMSEYELKQIAQDAASKITRSPAGRVIDPHSPLTGRDPMRQLGGPLQERTLKIPDEEIMDFLDHDVERLARYYTRSVAPDVALMREFGDLELSEIKMKIQDEANALKRRVLQDAKMSEAEFARLGEAATEARRLMRTGRSAEVTPEMKAAIEKIEGIEAEHLAIQKMADRDMRDLQAMADRLRHAYALPEDASGRIPRLARMVKSINYLRLMGGMTISAIPDLARHVMVNGIGNNLDGMVQALANFKAARKSMEEVKLAGTALDMVLDSRALGIADMMDNFGAHSRFERGIETLQGNYGIVSLMAPWNAAAKQWAGFIVQTNILRAARDVSDGKALSRGTITRMAKSGLDAEIMQRIWTQFMQHGEIEGKVMIANTDAWTDDIARNAYRAAIVGDVDRIIVSPGQEKPLWMSTQTGSIIGQFKSFGLVSVQRVTLAAIQQRDAGVYVGAMMAVALGVAVEYLKAMAYDKQLPKSTEQLIYAGVGNSGLTGWLYDADHLMYRASRGTIGVQGLVGAKEPISRYKSQNVSSALAGPSAGALQDILQAFGGAASGDIRQSDLRAMRRLIPYQNLFYLGKVIRNVEDRIIEEFNLPKMKPRVGGALG